MCYFAFSLLDTVTLIKNLQFSLALKRPGRPPRVGNENIHFVFFCIRTVAPLPANIGTTVKWPPPCKIYFVIKHNIIENGRTILDFV